MASILTQLLSSVLRIKGQKICSVNIDENTQSIDVYCRRDRRFKVKDPATTKRCTVNTYASRTIQDLPISGKQCRIHIELAQVRSSDGERRIEESDFVEKGVRYSKRFCEQICGLCRYMPISAIARHFGLRWEAVKNIDKAALHRTLPPSKPSLLKNLTHIGVDEVARAKGHDYMTVVYDMNTGRLIWVEHGRTSATLGLFLTELTDSTAKQIKAVAMDMGDAYIKAVREHLPNADIVFDRFHVMQLYSKLIRQERSFEFKKADSRKDKALIKGSLFLLLKNADKLSSPQSNKLDDLLESNKHLCVIYMLKEQLQEMWNSVNYQEMRDKLEHWCQLAKRSGILSLWRFSDTLQRHKQGICNYATYRLTSAAIEAGNVSIGMLRKRARGIRDTEYFKLKIKQISVSETASIFYPAVKLM